MTYQKFKAPPPLSKDQILAIAKRKGHFVTSPRWRDDKVRCKCFELVRAGKLKHSKHYHKWNNQEFDYVPISETNESMGE
jgi:hypothetical protein